MLTQRLSWSWRNPAVRILTGFLFGTGFIAPAGHAAVPSFNRFEPLSLPPNQSTELTVRGENLDDSTRLWTSFPSAVARLPDGIDGSPSQIRFQVTLSADVPPQLGAIRLVGRGGVSQLGLVMIDDMPTAPTARGRHSREEAPLLRPPVAVEDRMEPLKMHYYAIETEKGEQLSLDVVASRLGSQLDPLLRLLDADGNELAYLDDEPGIRPDLRLRHTFEIAGRYWLELRDVTYRGGGDSFYRLRLGDFPLVTVSYPMSVPAGQRSTIQPLGRAVGGLENAGIRMPEHSPGTWWAARYSVGGASCSVPVHAIHLPLRMEQEPNATFDQANSSVFPAVLAGRLEREGDRDCFQFQLGKDERVTFVSQTRSLGSPCDLWMQIEDAQGKKLAEGKVPDEEDTHLTFDVPEDGTYILAVEELNRLGGPDYTYQIEVRHASPSFALSLEQDRAQAAPGESLSLKVQTARQSYDGPIELSVWALDARLAVEEAVIGEKKTETTLKLVVPENWDPRRLVHLKVKGQADIDGNPVVRTASVRPALEKQFPNTRLFPFGLEDRLALGVREKK